MTTPAATPPNPSSPEGQIESIGGFALGLTRKTGWRRQVPRWGVVALLATPLVWAIVAHLAH